MNTENIKKLIEKYKSIIKENKLEDEKYKWELLARFKGRPDTEAEDFGDEILQINYANLIYQMANAVLRHIAKEKPEELRTAFKDLFDENKDLKERLIDFDKSTLAIYRSMGQTKSHHQDERSMATYLTYKYPEKYTFYKSTMYETYCQLIGEQPKKKYDKYIHYLSLIEDLIQNYITKDTELIELVKSIIPDYYDGTNHLLLAQDILYQTLDKNKKKPNYWIFQANPNIYDLQQGLINKDKSYETWYVNQHLDKIKKGDKVILWQTGKNAGVYALATTTTDVFYDEEDGKNVIGLKIDRDLSQNPVRKEMIPEKILNDMNIGNQGTNFTATKEQYDAILKSIQTKKTNIWLFAPGENAFLWEEMYQNNLMCIGWNDLGDLNQYKTKADIKKALIRLNPENNNPMNDTHANYEFRDVIKPGDIVIAKKGISKLLGYGIVTSDYFYDNNKESYQKCRKVNWKKKGEWDYNNGSLSLKTLTNITAYVDFLKELAEIIGIPELAPYIKNSPKQSAKKTGMPYNTILYGPPGTGKTYLARQMASEMITGHKKFNQLTGEDKSRFERQYAFVQFHPSYDYTDFVEGLRPVKKGDTLGFELRNGIFKDFCKRAKNDPDNNYVFVIDEINRAEISKVFGELFFAIDPGYRGEEGKVKTQFSNIQTEETYFTDLENDYFYIPENVYIIGTMNDIDRSVESFDFAMRRRFVWKEISAEERMNIWQEQLDKTIIPEATKRLKNLNCAISNTEGLTESYHIGPAYFLKLKDYNNDFKKLWTRHLEVLLKEYLRGLPDSAANLNRLKAAYDCPYLMNNSEACQCEAKETAS